MPMDAQDRASNRIKRVRELRAVAPAALADAFARQSG
jgi:hypothetical protein